MKKKKAKTLKEWEELAHEAAAEEALLWMLLEMTGDEPNEVQRAMARGVKRRWDEDRRKGDAA